MADNELAAKLARRQMLIDEYDRIVSVDDAMISMPSSNTNESLSSSSIDESSSNDRHSTVDSELAIKFARRHHTGSRLIYNRLALGRFGDGRFGAGRFGAGCFGAERHRAETTSAKRALGRSTPKHPAPKRPAPKRPTTKRPSAQSTLFTPFFFLADFDGETAYRIKASIYAEFAEFSRKQIKHFICTFKKFDENCDGYIDFNELKRMMERVGEPQTHLSLKSMIVKVDDDHDGRINLREFLRIFQMAARGELDNDESSVGLRALADRSSCDVAKEGVAAAADFFQSKIEILTRGSQFEEEIKIEQAERRQQDEDKRQRRQLFLANRAMFK